VIVSATTCSTSGLKGTSYVGANGASGTGDGGDAALEESPRALVERSGFVRARTELVEGGADGWKAIPEPDVDVGEVVVCHLTPL